MIKILIIVGLVIVIMIMWTVMEFPKKPYKKAFCETCGKYEDEAELCLVSFRRGDSWSGTFIMCRKCMLEDT